MPPIDQVQQQAFEGIREWVRTTLGISFPDNKLDSLRSRIDSVLRDTRIEDMASLRRALVCHSSPEVLFKVSQAMTTNHTFFFREPDTLHALFEYLPEASCPPFRVWSAACSTGQEPYSLAMLARERFGEQARGKVAFLATDISHRAISAATQGVYAERELAAVSAERRGAHFRTNDGRYEVAENVRELITFRRLNLTVGQLPFRKKFHAIYCRNVLYYFEPDLRARVARRLFEHLVEGGYLYTSVTEALRGLDTPWTYVRPGTYRKEGP